MSKQVNFFADPVDASLLHDHLLQRFPKLHVVPRRGMFAELRPRPFAEGELPGNERQVYLVPSWARDRLVYTPLGGSRPDQYVLAVRDNPVIEYRPCEFDPGENCVKVGRLYWAYAGELSDEQRRQIDRLMSWVRSHTKRIDKREVFRIFDHAARTVSVLDYGFDIRHPNPFRHAETGRSGGAPPAV